MPFIGQNPSTGGYNVLDNITISSNTNGPFNMLLNGAAFTPETANHLIVSLNGVIQKPGSSFTVSGSQITFVPSSGTLTSADSIDFIMALGNVLNVGAPTDGSVSTNKIATNAVSTAKIASGAVTSPKLELTTSTGTHTQSPNADNVMYDAFTGLTLPDKSLIIVSFFFESRSGANNSSGMYSTVYVGITDSSDNTLDNETAGFALLGVNPMRGYGDIRGQVSYFNATGSALTNVKVRHQQYANSGFNACDVRCKYRIVEFG